MNQPPPRARLPDWEARLHAVEIRHAAGSWQWGVHDCAALFADAVEAVTGRDPFFEFYPGDSGADPHPRPRWASEREAAEMLVRSGYRSVREFVIDRFRPVAASQARRGDVGYLGEGEDRLASPALILGPVALSWRPEGRVLVSRDLISEAFAV